MSKAVLELGAGSGFVGIATAILGAREVILTDLEYTMELMQENITSNMNTIKEGSSSTASNDDSNDDNMKGCLKIECHVCDWFKPPSIVEFGFLNTHPQVILVADCVWVEELVDPLMNTLDLYCQEETLVFISYQKRGKSAHDQFWQRLKHLICSFFQSLQKFTP